MLATDLSNAEIVLGKLGVRLIPVLGLIACVLPVVALTSLLGGIDPLALVGSFLVAIGCAFVGCSLAMTLSVYGRKTHEVLIMTYILIVLWILARVLLEIVSCRADGTPPRRAASAGHLQDGVRWSNPYFLVMAPYSDPGPGRPDDLPGIPGGLPGGSRPGCVAWRRRGSAAWRLRQAGRPAAGRGWRLSRLLRPHGCRGCPVRRLTSTRWPGASGTARGRR